MLIGDPETLKLSPPDGKSPEEPDCKASALAPLLESYLENRKPLQAKRGCVDLRHAQLDRTNWETLKTLVPDIQIKAGGVRLHGAKLEGIDLSQALLQNAHLEVARLAGADLRLAKLKKARLQRAQMQGAELQAADLTHAKLCEADLTGADLTQTDLTGANLTNATVSCEQIRSAKNWQLAVLSQDCSE